MRWIISPLLLVFCLVETESCPNQCSFHGTCNIFSQCECFAGRRGADCSERICPSAAAWVGPPVATDSGHQTSECANAGVCDRASGVCSCFRGFSGHACERLVCPATSGVECSGHGKCLSMENYAKETPNNNAHTYGLDGIRSLSHESFQVDDEKQTQLGSTASPLRSWYAYNEVWDASMIMGCMCDFPWTGYDCSQRECPRGDDPLTTGQGDEVQLVECNTTYRSQYVKLLGDSPILEGTFALQYSNEVTRPMPHNATAGAMAQLLRALNGIRGASSADDGGEVEISVATDLAPDTTQRSWNLTLNEESNQAPLVPLYKQPEVQVTECAADRGFLTLIFPAPYAGSAFRGVCFGGPRAGSDCIRSEDCVRGILTGEGTKCGPKSTEEVQLKFDATAAEVKTAVERFSLIDKVSVNFSDTGRDSLCTPGGNVVAITFLRTRLDLETKGDIPMLMASAGSNLQRKSTPVADGHGTVVLAPFREAIRGFDTCFREEVQKVGCKAQSGTFNVAFLGSSASVPFNATVAQTKDALQTLQDVENVTVEYSEEGGIFCGSNEVNTVTITFHAMAESFYDASDGDIPELSFDSMLQHPYMATLAPAATEFAKGLICVPLSATFVPTRSDDRVSEQYFKKQELQMTAGEVYPNRDGGHFVITYRGEPTALIPARAGPSDVESALNDLPNLHGVSVSFTRVHACESPANVLAVTFLGDFGRLSPLGVKTHQMPPSAHLRVVHGGKTDSTGTVLSVSGTKENDVCSNHGRCLPELGVCDCFTSQDFGYDHAFTSSDGRGGAGTRGDCGYKISPRGDPRSIWHMKKQDRSGGAAVLGTYKEATRLVHERSWGKDFPVTDCPGLLGCSGHGHCTGPPSYRCECAKGWAHAADCSEQECPSSAAWFDYPSANNRAHHEAECSNRGNCDRDSGECRCQAGFTGAACQFSVCPGHEVMNSPGKKGMPRTGGDRGGARECSGHGRCVNMKQFARLAVSERGELTEFTYGDDANNPYTWEATKMRGCFCDEAWQGADCSERVCPFGDDPNTHDDVVEVQLFNCSATAGSFLLAFRSIVHDGDSTRRAAITPPIAFNASLDEVEAALEELPTIEDAIVTFSSDSHGSVCVGEGEEPNVISVRFRYETGDLPPLVAETSSLIFDPLRTFAPNEGGGTGRIHVASGGERIHGITSIAGSRERLECSGRGVCNRESGVCECFAGYASGNGLNENERGTRGDCGYLIGDRLLLRGAFRATAHETAHNNKNEDQPTGAATHENHGDLPNRDNENLPPLVADMLGQVKHQQNQMGRAALMANDAAVEITRIRRKVLSFFYRLLE